MDFIQRTEETLRIREGLAKSPITTLFGPRQAGKTWLVRPFATSPEQYFDAQNFVDQVRLEESNFRILDGLEGVVVIDEAQEMQDLFPKLRVLADRPNNRTRFILTGSASPDLHKHVSESLAGRVHLLSLSGFSLAEVGGVNFERLWLRGGFPLSYLRENEHDSLTWRLDYISTFLGRDLPALAETKLSQEQLRRLFQQLAHYHGQYWNHSEVAGFLGVSYKTVQRYVEIFKGAFLLRELPPYFENAGKRLRKAPKLFIRDTGLLHALLMIRSRSELYASPRFGPSWEGLGVEQLITLLRARDEECYTWSVQSGAEVDLLINRAAGPIGFEFKAGDAPKRTRSMMAAIEALELEQLYVVYPGEVDYLLGEDGKIKVVGIKNLPKLATELMTN